MTQKLTINRDYWLNINPQIEFHSVRKAFYGTHLLKAKLHISGASIRYYLHDTSMSWKQRRNKTPTYEEYVSFLREHSMRFGLYSFDRIEGDILYATRIDSAWRTRGARLKIAPPRVKTWNCRTLHTLHNLLTNRPEGIRLSREQSNLYVYGNNIDDIEAVINELQVPPSDILSLTSPNSENIDALLAGKEINTKANEFAYKVYFKPAQKAGLPDLDKYLESIKDTGDIELPSHCKRAIAGSEERFSWSYYQRSYMYVKSLDTVLLIQLLSGDRFSAVAELIMPTDES